MARATRAQQQRRIDELTELLLQGVPRRKILEWVAQKAAQPDGELWVLSERQIDTYIAIAHKRIAELAKVDRSFETGRAVGRLNSLYIKAVASGNTSQALKVQREIDRLLALGPQDAVGEQPDPAAVCQALLLEFDKMNAQGQAADDQRR